MPQTTVANSLAGIAPTEIRTEYRRRGGASWTDRALVAAAGTVLTTPRTAAADSFVLHAPLELLARAGLLAWVEPESKERAHERIAWLAAKYEAAGDPVERPAAATSAAPADLVAAIAAGDLDAIDRIATALGTSSTALDLRRALAEPIAPSLAAAGHTPILLYLFRRVGAAAGVSAQIVRGPARELGRHPDSRTRWFEQPGNNASGPTSLVDALLNVPVLGTPGSDFIYPVMHQAEASGVAADLLGRVVDQPVEIRAARHAVTRVAALSMLQEPPRHTPYGWTHCLTMAQAVMGLAGDGLAPRTAVAIAGTYVVGFRAALGERTLDPRLRPAPEARDLADALASGPEAAAATVFHAPDAELDAVVATLATRASLHHDAHLVKYTLACFDAAADDPSERRLYLAAAASLSAWWAQHPGDGFFDGA